MKGEPPQNTYRKRLFQMKTKLDFKTASVVGVGISNTPLIEWLIERGAFVTARDQKTRDRLEPLASRLESKGVRIVCGEAYLDGITDEVIFRTPGIRYDKPQLRTAVARGARLTSEMEFFFELCPCPIVGITGSDGKTTTTTIISKLLEAAYGEEHVYLGGNIGRPLLPEVENMTPADWAVVELSSFQLQTMYRSPRIAVITNVTPNHLDYHIDMIEYIDAKRNIYRGQTTGDRLVLNAGNAITREMAQDAVMTGNEIRMFGFDEGGIPSEVLAQDGNSCVCRGGAIYCGGEHIMDTADIKLPGRHNIENYMAAVAALYGHVETFRFAELARSFEGVEHRIELVRNKDGVRYYNSSIDSSPTRTLAALSSFAPPADSNERRLIVICGGYDKQLDYAPLGEPLCRLAKAVVLCGATSPKIKSAVTACPGYKRGYPLLREESTLEKAVKRAASLAKAGDIVLLSPASASFDMFKNFEERGLRFKDLVNHL